MIQEILAEVRDSLRVQPLDPTKPVAMPAGLKTESLERFLVAPERARGVLEFQKIDSLLEYAERHHVADQTAIFADAAGNVISATLNWHAATDHSEETGWGDHSASYALKFTREFTDWSNISGKALTQTQFADFLEEHLNDIATPDPATMLEAVSKLSGKRNITFESSKRLDNGDVSIEWKEDTQTSNSAFPSKFEIKVPVYKGAEKATTFAIKALLRYRINEGRLSFEVKLLHIDQIRDLAFDEIMGAINKIVSGWTSKPTPIYTGSITKKP